MWKRSGHEVTTLCLSIPESRNALTCDAVKECSDALRAIAVDSSIRVVVLTGDGPAFSSGADRSELRDIKSVEHLTELLNRAIREIEDLPQPVICRVNGDAYGGGLALLSACDITVASEHAWFALPETRFGMVATAAITSCAGRIGQTAALDLFLSGRKFSADEAWRIGLITQVAVERELDDAVQKYIEQILLGQAQATERTKKMIRDLGKSQLRMR
jgi:methylglutaconyl-CoA hydratase